jgi:predicted RNA-binding Zn ribbon-like protein
LRETLYRAFSATSQHQSTATDDLQQINDAALEALQHRFLALANGGDYRWEWLWDEKNPLERILWPVAQSAAELLTSDNFAQCASARLPIASGSSSITAAIAVAAGAT